MGMKLSMKAYRIFSKDVIVTKERQCLQISQTKLYFFDNGE